VAKAKEIFWQVVDGHAGFILIVFLCNYLTIFWANYHLYHFAQLPVVIWDGLFLFAAVMIYTILIDILPWHGLRCWLYRITAGLSLALLAMEVFCIYHYQSLVGAGIVTAVLETNPHETVEFLRMYVGWQGAVLLAAAAGLAKHWGSHLALPGSCYMKRSFFLLLFLAGLVGGIVLIRQYESFIVNDSLDVPALQTGRAAQLAVTNIQAYKKLEDEMVSDVHITANDSNIPDVVFILGEATSRHHMHLYGYALDDTPNLDELKAKGEIAVFTDVISPQSATSAVLKEDFTFHDVESDQPWYKYNSLVDVMKAAGYRTYWLSNQESTGIWGNVAQLFAKQSDVHEFTRFRESHEEPGILDEALFPLIDRYHGDAAAKKFFLVHLMGGHSLYYMRYPYIFTKFSADDIKNSLSEEKRLELAQYANAIYYNDYVVSSIFDRFRDDDALVIYMPDHGETIYDEGSNFAGHVEENPNRYMLEIPFIVWASPRFRANHPEKWEAIEAAVNRPYMADDIIHTVMDIDGIHTTEWQASKSLFNPAFDAARQRIVKGRDYDTEMK
jgi:heptose-I-phosphate ethanolaminephosphotransferase